jgi:hypothetical protein
MIASTWDPRVHLTSTLGWHPGDDLARQYLCEMKRRADPILAARRWRILELREFFPRSKQLLGLNVNRGQEVCVRLRDPRNRNLFLPFEAAMATLLHEMAHCKIGPHNEAFWGLYKELVEECERREVETVVAAAREERAVATSPLPQLRAPPAAEDPAAAAASSLRKPAPLVPFSGAGRQLGGTVRIPSPAALRAARQAEASLRLRMPIMALAEQHTASGTGVTHENAGRGSCGLSQPCDEGSNPPADVEDRSGPFWKCCRCGHCNERVFVFCEACTNDAPPAGAFAASSDGTARVSNERSHAGMTCPVFVVDVEDLLDDDPQSFADCQEDRSRKRPRLDVDVVDVDVLEESVSDDHSSL